VACPTLLDILLAQPQILIKIMFHWHEVPPQVNQ
jgi:hypothetical protein